MPLNFYEALVDSVQKSTKEYRQMQQHEHELRGGKKFHLSSEAMFVAMVYHYLRLKKIGADNLRLEYPWTDLDDNGNPIKGSHSTEADITYNRGGTWKGGGENEGHCVVEVKPVWTKTQGDMKRYLTGIRKDIRKLEGFLPDDSDIELVMVIPYLGKLSTQMPNEIQEDRLRRKLNINERIKLLVSE